jgi:hypothetical protein
MNKPIIVQAPPDLAAKYGQRIAKHFGLAQTFYNWRGTLDHGTLVSLYLTDRADVLASCRELNMDVRTLEEVAQQINAAIPRTQWFGMDSKPVHVGPYETKLHPSSRSTWQHWNGKRFGGWALTADTACERRVRHTASHFQNVEWRGLAEEPIVVPA